jgi:hypothetical protein
MKRIDENNMKPINLKKGDRMIVNLKLSGDIEFEPKNKYELYELFKTDPEIMKLKRLMIDEYGRIDGDNTININFKCSSESIDTGDDIISKYEIERTRDFNGNVTDQMFKMTEIKNKKREFISYRGVETLEDGDKINVIATYDSIGKLITKRYTKGSLECYTFRSDNGVVSENYDDGDIKTNKIYTTRENDATEKIVVHSKEGDNTIRTEINYNYIYDNNNRLVCILTENNNTRKISQSIVRDPFGNILSNSIYDNNGNLINVYKYDRIDNLLSTYRELIVTKYEGISKDVICKKFKIDNRNRLIGVSSNSRNKFIEAEYHGEYRGDYITEIKCHNKGFDQVNSKDMTMKIVIDGDGNERTEVFINTDSNKSSPLLIFTRERSIGKTAMSFREECFADIDTSMLHDIHLMYNEYNLSYNNYNGIIFGESSFYYYLPHEIRGY